MRVEVKPDMTMYGTPFCLRIPLKGNAINPGIRVIEPKSDAIIRLMYLFSFDKCLDITFPGIKNNTNETIHNTTVSGIIMLIAFLPAIFNPDIVFFLSFLKEIVRIIKVIPAK